MKKELEVLAVFVLSFLLFGFIINEGSKGTHWAVDKTACISSSEKICGGNSPIFRIIDYQTGKVIYVLVDNSAGRSIGISVSNLEKQ